MTTATIGISTKSQHTHATILKEFCYIIFDEHFYRSTYPDVSALKNPFEHFWLHGCIENRTPSPYFSPEFYQKNNPDIDLSENNSFFHFLKLGMYEGRDPSIFFDTELYAHRNHSVRESSLPPFEYFIRVGAALNHQTSTIFDPLFYRTQNPDVDDAQIAGLTHFLLYGGVEGRNPSVYFDSCAYIQKHKIENIQTNPLNHYLDLGAKTAREELLTCQKKQNNTGTTKNGYSARFFHLEGREDSSKFSDLMKKNIQSMEHGDTIIFDIDFQISRSRSDARKSRQSMTPDCLYDIICNFNKRSDFYFKIEDFLPFQRKTLIHLRKTLLKTHNSVSLTEKIKLKHFDIEVHLNKDDKVITPFMKKAREWEPFETQCFLQLIKEGDIVVDIGANIGYYALLAANIVGPRGAVYAFEPDPVNYSILTKNIKANNASIEASSSAISDYSGEQLLFIDENNKGDHRLFRGNTNRPAISIATERLDDFFAQKEVYPTLIKMDIQGWEGHALRGMENLLSSPNPPRVLLEFWPHGLKLAGSDPSAILKHVLNLGFLIYHVNEFENKTSRVKSVTDFLKNHPKSTEFFSNILLTKSDQNPSPLRAWSPS